MRVNLSPELDRQQSSYQRCSCWPVTGDELRASHFETSEKFLIDTRAGSTTYTLRVRFPAPPQKTSISCIK